MEPQHQRFRSSYWRTLLPAIHISVVLLFVIELLFDGMQIDFREVLLLIVLSIVWNSFWIGIIVWYFTIEVASQGIRAYDVWGRYRISRWESFESVRRRNVLGLRYVCVSTDDSSWPLWLPTFLNDMRGFEELVITYADEGNPLAEHFLSLAEW